MKMNKIRQILGTSLAIAKADFRLKNEGTWLGVLWYLLAPIMVFLLLLGIFNDRLGRAIPDYPLYLILGIILFSYFQKITDESIRIIRSNAGIIKSLNFPRESLIVSVVLKNIFAHLFEVVVLVAFLLFFKISVKTMVFYLPILVFVSIFSFGVSLVLSSLETYFFDLDNIWGFGSKLIWFATPIFYAIEGQTRLGILNLFNPMYYFITVAREAIIYARLPQLWMLSGMIGYSLLSLIVGWFIFNKLKQKFVEII